MTRNLATLCWVTSLILMCTCSCAKLDWNAGAGAGVGEQTSGTAGATYGAGGGASTEGAVPTSAQFVATSVASGYRHNCAVLDSGSIQCWGYNECGQLGNVTATDSTVPVFVSGISKAIALAAGEFHACALLTNGSIQR